MQIRYSPPKNDQDECEFLENNFMQCLEEKSQKDALPQLKCNMENVLWYYLDCPKFAMKFQNLNYMKMKHTEFQNKPEEEIEEDDDFEDDDDY